jgi:hypothetical protein
MMMHFAVRYILHLVERSRVPGNGEGTVQESPDLDFSVPWVDYFGAIYQEGVLVDLWFQRTDND